MQAARYESAELTDLGRHRSNNEDDCLRAPEAGVFCVADGMGGAAGGDLASEAITTNLKHALAQMGPDTAEALAGRVQVVREAINRASHWIKNFADEKILGQMGSTVVSLVFDPRHSDRAVSLHAGDSRLYRFRRGQLDQITCDHTTGEALAAKSGKDLAEIPARFRNELTRAVGIRETVELAESEVDVLPGDLFLLCSDGLTRMVEDQGILRILGRSEHASLQDLAGQLVAEANFAGGKDNVTVVLVRVSAPADTASFTGTEGPASTGEGITRSGLATQSDATSKVDSPAGSVGPQTGARERDAHRPRLGGNDRARGRSGLGWRRLLPLVLSAACLLLAAGWYLLGRHGARDRTAGPSLNVGDGEVIEDFAQALESARAAHHAGDISNALRHVESAIRSRPDHREAHDLRSRIHETRDLGFARAFFQQGNFRSAIEICGGYPSTRTFADLGARATEELKELEAAQARFAVGDYSFISVLEYRPFSDKPPVRDLLNKARMEQGILGRVMEAKKRGEWKAVRQLIRANASLDLIEKVPFREADRWAADFDPAGSDPAAPLASRETLVQFERMLVWFGCLEPTSPLLRTSEARSEIALGPTISTDRRDQCMHDLLRFESEYGVESTERRYYSRSDLVHQLRRSIHLRPTERQP